MPNPAGCNTSVKFLTDYYSNMYILAMPKTTKNTINKMERALGNSSEETLLTALIMLKIGFIKIEIGFE
jgi:hypothetical protein